MAERALVEVTSLPGKCIQCAVRTRGLCSALTVPQLSGFSSRTVRQGLNAGTTLVREGEQRSFHTCLISGVAKSVKTMSDGRRHIVSLHIGPVTILAPQQESLVTVEASTDMEICTAPVRLVDVFAERARDIDLFLMRQARQELDEARGWLLALGRKNAIEKLASFLIMLAIKCGQKIVNGTRITIPLTRLEIGEFLGLAIETTSRTFTRLRATKTVGLEGVQTVVILDASGLEAIAGE